MNQIHAPEIRARDSNTHNQYIAQLDVPREQSGESTQSKGFSGIAYPKQYGVCKAEKKEMQGPEKY
jgi:hypothetical protein